MTTRRQRLAAGPAAILDNGKALVGHATIAAFAALTYSAVVLTIVAAWSSTLAALAW